jgi:BirA family biotin operon repressor/biotin-[acetyl-CoA-carboxylase] ligase
MDGMTVGASPSTHPFIVHLGVVDSTQSHALHLAEAGVPDGTVVVADVQTAGRGRRGRGWAADAGTSLLCSIVVRPRLATAALPLVSLATAVAVAETLVAHEVAARIKWPNDVLARGRKIAGILLESRLGVDTVVVVGIGVNLAQHTFPVDLAEHATSVWLETGQAPAVGAFLDALLARFAAWRQCLEGHGFASVRERWRALSATLGTTVSIDGIRGVARDLDTEGRLVVDDGTCVHRMVAGALDDAARR